MTSPEVREAVAALIGAPHAKAAQQAAAALSLLALQGALRPGDLEVVAPVAEVLGRDARAGVRAAAALALGAFVDGAVRAKAEEEALEASIAALGAALRDPDPETRAASVRALRPVRREALIGPLLVLLGDPSAAVRLEALISLDGLKPLDDSGRVRSGAAALLEDPSEPVRRAAILVAR